MENIPRIELIQVAEAVAREKLIDKEEVILAMEDAIQRAARSKYGLERDIRATVNRNNGAISIEQYTQVVQEVEDESTQMSLEEALRRDKSLKIGDYHKKELPHFDFGRIAAQSAKQVISQKVRDAERLRQYNQFKDRVGEIILGTVKRFDNFSVTLDIGKAEGVIRKEEMIPREQLKPGDRVRTYILSVSEETRGPQIFLSRSCNEFLSLLFTQEVPEIYDGIIEVKSVAREPGSRAKISVYSKDNTIDPVGACVGMRGSRVQAVVNELQGEKIDIVNWNEVKSIYVQHAIAPAQVAKVNEFEDSNRVEVVLPEDQLSIAIGRRGQNVKLASILTGLEIDILTEKEDAERRQEEFKKITNLFAEKLDLEDMIAQLLAVEGYTSIEKIANASVTDIEKIEGFDGELAAEIYDRASQHMANEKAELEKFIQESSLDDYIKAIAEFDHKMLATLIENKILTRQDLADLATDELVGKEGILQKRIEKSVAEKIIMDAREIYLNS